MCVSCFVGNILDAQFFEGMNVTHSLFCPCCIEKISKHDWNRVIDVLVNIKLIQPECIFSNDVYNTYQVVYKWYTPPPIIDESYRICLSKNNFYI